MKSLKHFGILIGLSLMVHAIHALPVDIGENSESDNTVKEGEPSKRFLAEVQKYFEKQKTEKTVSRDTRQTSNALNHGDTIALQSFQRNQWLSCSDVICRTHPCPGVYFSGNDWTTCFGEVFQIYRAAGTGHVTVGDLVGIHYPFIRGLWLGCPSYNCEKTTCPGWPNAIYGFASETDWYRCWGEVFMIYASGKNDDEVINSGDDIMLYYLQEGNWISKVYDSIIKQTCPGTARPPPVSKYDTCSNAVFKIIKR